MGLEVADKPMMACAQRRTFKLRFGLVFLGAILVTVGAVSNRAEALKVGECRTWFSQLLEPTAKLRAARAKLAAQIEANLANPPMAPVRTFRPEEIQIVSMRKGRAFDYDYRDDFGVVEYWKPKKSIGNELRFTKSDGSKHTVTIVGSSLDPEGLERMTKVIASLPADVLEATKQVELQGFVRNNQADGYAQPSGFVVHEGGMDARTVVHEFGHNVAQRIWGRFQPYVEWQEAYKKDGERFVSLYASGSFNKTPYGPGMQFSEDFADSVQLYLQRVDYFRGQFPNRAALLDTIFRNGGDSVAGSSVSPLAPGGVWHPLQAQYNRSLSRTSRAVEEQPVLYSSFVVAGAGGVSLVRLVYDKVGDSKKPPEKNSPAASLSPKLPPKPSATPK